MPLRRRHLVRRRLVVVPVLVALVRRVVHLEHVRRMINGSEHGAYETWAKPLRNISITLMRVMTVAPPPTPRNVRPTVEVFFDNFCFKFSGCHPREWER